MTDKKDLKRRIRARMEKTGESYQSARRNVVAGAQQPVDKKDELEEFLEREEFEDHRRPERVAVVHPTGTNFAFLISPGPTESGSFILRRIDRAERSAPFTVTNASVLRDSDAREFKRAVNTFVRTSSAAAAQRAPTASSARAVPQGSLPRTRDELRKSMADYEFFMEPKGAPFALSLAPGCAFDGWGINILRFDFDEGGALIGEVSTMLNGLPAFDLLRAVNRFVV